MRSRLLQASLSGLLLGAAGCNQAHPDAAAAAQTRLGREPAVSAPDDLNTDGRLRAVAGEFRDGKYTTVGSWAWALTSCIAFVGPGLDFSDAPSDTAHGMKIYRLSTKDPKAFYLADKEDQPVGQVIVKESWVPSEVTTEEGVQTFYYAERDGKKYKPNKPSDLFVMLKEDPATAGTDDGWIYGIVTPDGKQVISSGRIKTCVDCHRQARHDRVFGEKPKAE